MNWRSMRATCRNRLFRLLWLLLAGNIQFVAGNLYAQPPLDINARTYTLVNPDENVIQNAAYLDDFFEKLIQLKSTGKGKINIVHIGDSHIQADYLTSVVRKDFQQEFGNAGRGLVVPLRVAGTNEPVNFRTSASSSTAWKSKRGIYVHQPLPIGIGGVTLSTVQPNARITLCMNDPLYDYSFNTVTLFYQKDAQSFDFSIQDSSGTEKAIMTAYTGEPFANYSRVLLPAPTNQITLQTLQPTTGKKRATIFGVNLENGKDGILYHSIGINGAKYMHYNAALYFAKQTQALQPDLFIISLGTNESLDYPYLDKSLDLQINKLILSLSEYNPQAKFILVTPPDSFRRKINHNPGIEAVREHIIRYAVENGFAFWDMYKVNGGKYSASEWKLQGLLRPDGVHFSKEGYAYQGSLLYEAIMKSYKQYVPLRHP